MPVILLRHGGAIAGVAMGYDTRRLPWPDVMQARLARLEQLNPQTAKSFESYDAASERHKPRFSHYYLGVIGVDPSRQRTGGGGILLKTFCERSDGDSQSAGVYLETANPGNVAFYRHHGFELSGAAELDSATQLYCLFRPKTGART